MLYVEQVGNPDGRPIVYLHGGPGSGCTLGARHNFDLVRHRAILFDQRGAGRSTPSAAADDIDWASIDMDHHVADIERIREHLGIERWAVCGLSWGSVLGLTYAERHPERVTAVVVAAVGMGTAAEVEWLTVHAGRFFPGEWEAFRDHVPRELCHLRLVDSRLGANRHAGNPTLDPRELFVEPAPLVGVGLCELLQVGERRGS